MARRKMKPKDWHLAKKDEDLKQGKQKRRAKQWGRQSASRDVPIDIEPTVAKPFTITAEYFEGAGVPLEDFNKHLEGLQARYERGDIIVGVDPAYEEAGLQSFDYAEIEKRVLAALAGACKPKQKVHSSELIERLWSDE